MSNKIDKSVILLILIAFTFSDSLWEIIWNIGKSLIYLIIFIFAINMINSSFANDIKNIINDLLNIGSNNFIKDTVSTISESTMNLIKSSTPIYTSNNRSLSKNVNTGNRTIL